MPRKVDPHWNEDAENWDDPGDARPLDTDNLALSIGLNPGTEKANKLNLFLFSIRHDYRSNHKFHTQKYTRAEARRALVEFRDQGQFDSIEMAAMNARAEECLFDELALVSDELKYHDAFLRPKSDETDNDESVIRKAIGAAIRKLNASKGPEKSTEILFAIERLCRLYQDLTDNPVTHSNKGENLAYVQEPVSDAGKFVRDCFLIIDDSVRETQLNRGLRKYVAVKNKKIF